MVITNIKYEQVFGNLTVLGLSLVRRSGPKQKPIYVCKCQCNKTVEVSEYDLISGHVKSCGCIHKKYDESQKGRLYEIWKNMRRRCSDPLNKRWMNYGGKGIKVCPEWNDYLVFRCWAYSNGYNDNLTIDRIDLNKDYCPSNCRWTDSFTQMNNTTRNKYLVYQGEMMTLANLARKVGLPYKFIQKRLALGWTVEDAISKPKRSNSNGI